MTADCVRSLEKCGYPKLEILIVDNGSEDGSAERLRNDFPFHHHMHLPLNLGYAGGNAAGLLRALEDDDTFAVLVINNDCLVSEGFMFPLVSELLDHADTGVAGPVQLVYEDGELLWANAGSRFSLWRARVIADGPSGDETPEPGERAVVGFHCGACALYRAETLRDVGVFDPKLFLFGEESDWSFRASKAGWKTTVLTSSKVIHLESQSTSTVPIAKTYYVTRNTSWLIRRHGNSAQKLIQVLRTFFGRGARSVLGRIVEGHPELAVATARGYIEGIWGDASRSDFPEEAAFHQAFELKYLDGSLQRWLAMADGERNRISALNASD
jgi:GT2 family glycosyltransferase